MGITDVAEKQAGNDGGAAGHAVDAVHEVESVGQADNPENVMP